MVIQRLVLSVHNYQEYSAQSKRSFQLLKRMAHFTLAVTLTGFLFGFNGCATSPEDSKRALPPRADLERYLETADNLNAEQKKQMASRRPFVGMTLEEANLAMRKEFAELKVSGATMQAVYVGGAGTRYYLYFEGEPPRVVKWTAISDDEIKLTDPELLRPSPPLRPF
jgi:hypothetical protein